MRCWLKVDDPPARSAVKHRWGRGGADRTSGVGPPLRRALGCFDKNGLVITSEHRFYGEAGARS